jgi:small redox-active disulfide protein 2
MKKIQVLGVGCAKCKALAVNAEAAARAVGGAQMEKVESLQEIMRFGVMITPALVVDGKVVSAGKVLTVDEISRLIA